MRNDEGVLPVETQVEKEGKSTLQYLFSIPVIIAALGYFVDIYDLLLFGVVRIPSLRSLGLSETQVSDVGAGIINWQMTGLLLGGHSLGSNRG